MAEERKDWQKMLDWIVASKLLYVIFIVIFALYLLTRSVIFAALTAISLIALFVAESVQSASKTGWKNELKEILIAVIVGGLIWYGSGFLLQTSAPLDAVISCSMLPNLERGDMVVLQGGIPQAPEIALSGAEFDAQDWKREQLVCALCERRNSSSGMIYNELCTASTEMTEFGLRLIGEVNQTGNLVQYECGLCTRKYANGTVASFPCTKSISVKGQRIEPNVSNDIIVYGPSAGNVFAGETIHRVLAKLNVDGKYYYLMKGDNNEQLDIQYGNVPAPQEKEVGKVVFRMPYVGYLKLFLFGFLGTPPGCDSTLGG